MFEQLPGNNKGQEPFTAGLKTLVIGAVGMLLSLGLCGAGSLLHRASNPEDFGALSVIGFGLFCLSALILVAGILMLLVASIVRLFPR